MKGRYSHVQTLRFISDYLTVVMVGIPLGVLFVLFIALGRIKIRGYCRAIHLLARGKVIIAANHPSMLETILIPLLFFPLFLFSLRFFVWSVPDKRLLGSGMRWLFWFGRCVTLDRSDPNSKKPALFRLASILQYNGNIVIHPEAGRTCKGDTFLADGARGNRRIRRFVSGVPSLARNTGATILPLWVSGTDIVLPMGTMVPRLMRSKIVFSFGTPYIPPKRKQDRQKESMILAKAILES